VVARGGAIGAAILAWPADDCGSEKSAIPDEVTADYRLFGLRMPRQSGGTGVASRGRCADCGAERESFHRKCHRRRPSMFARHLAETPFLLERRPVRGGTESTVICGKRFALGAAIGTPAARSNSSATGCRGMRNPTVGSPAVTCQESRFSSEPQSSAGQASIAAPIAPPLATTQPPVP